MILIAIGSNLPHPVYGDPFSVCQAAVEALSVAGCAVKSVSRWFRSASVPRSDQPDYINGIVNIRTSLSPPLLLETLHEIENVFGRRRSVPNAARILDLDLIAYQDVVMSGEIAPILPHPRMSERAFVLLPLQDVAPHWTHPVSGQKIATLAAALPEGQICLPV